MLLMLVCIQDSVTAITFVALGTSLPDLFASRQAATMDDTADNSIGNVTGSNSVNVFLGLGLPWLIATIFWGIKVCICTYLSNLIPRLLSGQTFHNGYKIGLLAEYCD